MTIDTFQSFFKSSARSAGQRLLNEAKVSFSKPSATEIAAYVKPNYRVILKSESLQSSSLNADCNCPPSKKGEFCKHIWAVFLAVFDKSPDFFENMSKITKNTPVLKQRVQSETQVNSQNAFKLKQDAYRKEQYQKQKARAKKFKKTKKKSFVAEPQFPSDVQTALDYFSTNGFSFTDSLNKESIFIARKKLARIFHPDVGGSHDESTELNSQSEVLLKFVAKLS